jgi:hypothetical protein
MSAAFFRRGYASQLLGTTMSFDTSTLYVVAAMITAMLGAMLVFFGRQEKIPALKWWGSAYLIGSASVALWTIAGTRLGAPLSLALTTVAFLSCGMVWNASRVFQGRKANWPGVVLGAIFWLATMTTLLPSSRPANCGTSAAVRCKGAGRPSQSPSRMAAC